MKNAYLFLIFFLLQIPPVLGMHADKEEIEGAYRAYKEDPKKFSKKLEVLKKNKAIRKLSLYHTPFTNIKCFVNLFPKGGESKTLNTTLLALNLDLELDLHDLKKIQKGLNRNLKDIK